MSTETNLVPCHSCNGTGRDTGDHERACKRCGGEGTRDAREAAAHFKFIEADLAESAAAVYGSSKHWAQVRAARIKAHEEWQIELDRVARENAEADLAAREQRDSVAA